MQDSLRWRHARRQMDLETQRPAYASEPTAPQHRDPAGDRTTPAPVKMCSPERTKRNSENSSHDHAKGRQAQQDSNTCSARPMKKNLETSSDGAGGHQTQQNSDNCSFKADEEALSKLVPQVIEEGCNGTLRTEPKESHRSPATLGALGEVEKEPLCFPR